MIASVKATESSSPSCYCFICGLSITRRSSRNGNPKFNGGMKKLILKRFCQLLSVEISEEDWGFLENLEEQSICCGKCLDLLKNVELVHQIILKRQVELKKYLAQIKTRFVKSEEQHCATEGSLWGRKGFKLRRNILNKVSPNSKDGGHRDISEIQVKEECEPEEDQIDGDTQQDFDDTFDDVDDETSNMEYDDVDENSSQEEKEEKILSENASENRITSSKRSSSTPIPIVLVKKLKIQGSVNSNHGIEEKSLQESGSGDSNNSDVEENAKPHNKNKDDDDDGTSTEEDNDDSDDKDYSKVRKCDDFDSKKVSSCYPKKKVTGKRVIQKPFVIAEENLYLYRGDTYIRKTFTQLQCLAYNCTFQTEFDFYSSFQRIREHLEENHRSERHLLRTPHPCVLCDTLFKRRAELDNHNKKVHADNFGRHSRVICECCLKPSLTIKNFKSHGFTHKNAEEQAAAERAPYKKHKNKQITEKFVCDFENCGRVYGHATSLMYHKQTHLPKGLRNDQVLCPECGKYYRKSGFDHHIKRMHRPETVDRYLLCSFCDKRFLVEDQCRFEAHIRQHKGEKPFLCCERGASFSAQNSLRHHLKCVHVKHDPIPCQWCDHIFIKYETFRSHVARHHSEKKVTDRTTGKFYEKKA